MNTWSLKENPRYYGIFFFKKCYTFKSFDNIKENIVWKTWTSLNKDVTQKVECEEILELP